MATDLERMIVLLEANITRYERQLAKAMGQTNSTARGIERRFNDMNRNISAGFGKITALAGGALSVNAIREFADSATRMDNALKIAGLSGASLTQVYDQLFASAQRNAAPLESLVTLYGRISQNQKELGVSSQDMIKFTDNVALALRVSGKSSQEASGALLQLSQAMGAGTVRAEEFNSMLEGAPSIVQAAANGIEEANGSVSKLRQLVNDGAISSKAFFLGFQAGAVMLETQVASATMTVAQGFQLINNALTDAVGKINRGSEAGETLARSLKSVAEAISAFDFGPLTNELVKFIDDIKKIASDISGFVREIQWAYDKLKWITGQGPDPAARAALEAQTKELKKQEGEARALASAYESLARRMTEAAQAKKPAAQGGTASQNANSRVSEGHAALSNRIRAADYAPKKKEEGGDGADIFQRAVAQAERRTAVLGAETAAIDLGRAAQARARVETELMTAAVRANEAAGLKNTEVTTKQAEKIKEVADAYMKVRKEAEKANSPLATFARQAKDTGALLQEAGLSGIRSLEDGLVDIVTGAASAEEAIKKMANAIIADIARIAIRQAITGPIAGALGSVFSGGGLPFGGARASGGPVQAGRGYIVGERGPEIMVPGRNGVVIPNKALQSRASGGSFTYAPVIDARGADQAAIARLERIVQQQGGQMRQMANAARSSSRLQSTGVN